MITLGAAPNPPSPEDLLAQLKAPLESLLREEIATDNDPEHVWQYRNARRNDLYYRGIQNIYLKMDGPAMVDYSSIGTPIPKRTTDGNSGYLDYVLNIIRGYGRKFTAVLGQRAPNVEAVPDDPSDEKSLKTTQMADIAASILRSQWDVDQRNLELAEGLYKSGTMFIFTDWVTNGLKYGYTQEPQMAMKTVLSGPPGQEQEMQVPVVASIAQYENGAVEISTNNITRVQVPYHIRRLEDATYLKYEYEEDRGLLYRAYPILRSMGSFDEGDGDSTGSSSNALGSTVRDAAVSPTGNTTAKRIKRWNFKRIWMTPALFETVKEQGYRQLLQQYFRDGLKATYVQGQLVALDAQKLTDYWVACKPETSDGIYADPICTDLISVQDLKNDIGINIPAETLQRGSFTFADPRVIDVPEWDKKQWRPGEVIPAIASAGDDLSNAFYQTQPPLLSPQAQPWIEMVENDGRQSVGIVPAIFGASSDAPTAHQAELEKNAALMQLGMTWLNMRNAWEQAYLNGVRLLSKYGIGSLKHSKKSSTTDYQTQILDFAELQDSGYHFESEESIPKTWGQKHDTVLFLLEKGPEVAALTGLSNAMNVPQLNDYIGLDNLYNPMRDQRNKMLKTIQQLLQGKPTQIPSPDGSVQAQPSIPPDPFDDPAMCAQVAAAWLIGDGGQAAKQDNPDGYANVIASWMAYKHMATPPTTPPPPKMSIQESSRDMAPEIQAALFEDYHLPNAAAAIRQMTAQQQVMGLQAAQPSGPPQPDSAPPAGAVGAAPPSGGPSAPPTPPSPGLSIPQGNFPGSQAPQ